MKLATKERIQRKLCLINKQFTRWNDTVFELLDTICLQKVTMEDVGAYFTHRTFRANFFQADPIFHWPEITFVLSRVSFVQKKTRQRDSHRFLCSTWIAIVLHFEWNLKCFTLTEFIRTFLKLVKYDTISIACFYFR